MRRGGGVTLKIIYHYIIRKNHLKKVLLDIKEEKAAFVMELLPNLSFVKVKKISSNKTQSLAESKESIEEVEQAREGKIALKSLDQLLKEL